MVGQCCLSRAGHTFYVLTNVIWVEHVLTTPVMLLARYSRIHVCTTTTPHQVTGLCWHTTLLNYNAALHCHTTLLHYITSLHCCTTLLHYIAVPHCYTTNLHHFCSRDKETSRHFLDPRHTRDMTTETQPVHPSFLVPGFRHLQSWRQYHQCCGSATLMQEVLAAAVRDALYHRFEFN